MMGCFFRCFSSRQSHRTLSRRKLTFCDRGDVRGEVPAGPAMINLTADSSVIEEKNRGGVGKKVAFDKDVETYKSSPARNTVRGDSVDEVVKEGKEIVYEMDSSPRERESVPASAGPISQEASSSSDGETSVEEESSDSLFSISIESREESRDNSYRGVITEKEVSSSVLIENPVGRNSQSRCLSQVDGAEDKCLGTVLNPVEILLPSRSLKGRATSPLKNHYQEENKENAGILPENIPRPGLKLQESVTKPSSPWDSPQIRDISVDASLSSWLVESDSTPESQRSLSGEFAFSDRARGRGSV